MGRGRSRQCRYVHLVPCPCPTGTSSSRLTTAFCAANERMLGGGGVDGGANLVEGSHLPGLSGLSGGSYSVKHQSNFLCMYSYPQSSWSWAAGSLQELSQNPVGKVSDRGCKSHFVSFVEVWISLTGVLHMHRHLA